jgi:hypothetical protein
MMATATASEIQMVVMAWRFFGGGFGVAERGRLRQASSKRNAEIVAIFDGASNQERKSRSRKASSADSLPSENQES